MQVLPSSIMVMAIALSAGVMILAFRPRRFAPKLALATVSALLLIPGLLLAIAVHPEWIDARHRTYKAFYHAIAIGMTREDVFDAMRARYPESGPRSRPTVLYDEPTQLGFFMNPEKSHEPNCEGIFLELSDGRISRKRYSSD